MKKTIIVSLIWVMTGLGASKLNSVLSDRPATVGNILVQCALGPLSLLFTLGLLAERAEDILDKCVMNCK